MKLEGHVLKTDIELLPCPFCGSEPTVEQIGNNATKKRLVAIKCRGKSSCGVEMRVGAIIHDVEWCQKTVSEKWNRRVGKNET